MTEREICYSYSTAKHKERQIGIITELTGKSRMEIIKILARGGKRLPKHVVDKLYSRLDSLDDQIREREREYREIAGALGAGRR